MLFLCLDPLALEFSLLLLDFSFYSLYVKCTDIKNIFSHEFMAVPIFPSRLAEEKVDN